MGAQNKQRGKGFQTYYHVGSKKFKQGGRDTTARSALLPTDKKTSRISDSVSKDSRVGRVRESTLVRGGWQRITLSVPGGGKRRGSAEGERKKLTPEESPAERGW